MRSRFLFKLFAGYALLVVVNALLFGILVAGWAGTDVRREVEENLGAQAALLREAVRPLGARLDASTLEQRVREVGVRTGTRFTVVARDGKVLADSVERPEGMENHLSRPEFVAAAAKGIGSAERTSATTGVPTFYVCLSVPDSGDGIGFVRASVLLAGLEQRLGRIRSTVIAGSAAGAALALLLAALVARRLTRPMTEMTRAAVGLGEGDHVSPIRHAGGDELGELAHAFNRMSVRLRDRVADLERERSKLTTVLESMAEGVVAVDAEERLIHCNRSARSMLSIPEGGGFGRPLVEWVRTPELIDALRRVQARNDESKGAGGPGAIAGVAGFGGPLVEEVRVLAAGRDRVVSIHAAPLADRGAVAVLLDVTELRRLETVRRDFVANVSHELKTPLTAMRGLVETLVEDAAMDPEVRRRFLGKLGDHVRRLSDLASDLLHLSRAESERPGARFSVDLGAAVVAVCERFAAAATAKQIVLRRESPDEPVVAPADPESVVQILDNLVDNAIKYTPSGGHVSIRAGNSGDRAVLEVEDDGIGIEPAEQKRVFERFYRVDKARSRDQPGTGLGLSIVKHLVDGHGGAVELQSWPGRGSTFRVFLPRAGATAIPTATNGNGASADSTTNRRP